MKRADGSDWELGCGGFGKVYKAMRNGAQPVAVKVLNVSAGGRGVVRGARGVCFRCGVGAAVGMPRSGGGRIASQARRRHMRRHSCPARCGVA